MATFDDLRTCALALPDMTEGTHFRLPAFRVSGQPIIGIDKDGVHATMRLDEHSVRSIVDDDPGTFAEVWQSGKHLIGIRFALAGVSVDRLHQLVELSWRTKAAKSLIQSYEASRSK